LLLIEQSYNNVPNASIERMLAERVFRYCLLMALPCFLSTYF